MTLDKMTAGINTYMFMRREQQMNPIDACTDSAQFRGIDVHELAQLLASIGVDSARLSLI